MKLTAAQKRKMTALGRKAGLLLLYVYGSRARGDFYAGSDLDLAYQSSRRLSLREEYGLRSELTQIFADENIDLVDISAAPPLLLYFIATEGSRLYGNPAADDSFYRRALMRFIDAKPLIEATKQYVKNYIEHI